MNNTMNKSALDILHYLYDNTTYHSFLTLYQLEVLFGMAAVPLRSLLEDLKVQGLVVETDKGYHISHQGRSFGQSLWV